MEGLISYSYLQNAGKNVFLSFFFYSIRLIGTLFDGTDNPYNMSKKRAVCVGVTAGAYGHRLP